LIPISVGVPTAPKETGVTLAISATITAARAGNPRDSSRGAARAAGVPNPAAPSMNPPNNQAMMMACTRRSAEMFIKPLLMASMAPLSRKVKSTRRAPNTMLRILKAITRPFTVAAATQFRGVFQTHRARASAIRKATGMARVAGHRNPTISTKMAAMGRNARRARNPVGISVKL
jgi:hypothetical protein